MINARIIRTNFRRHRVNFSAGSMSQEYMRRTFTRYECYGLIYKGECQGKYFSLDRKREPFLDFQPLSAM